MIDYRIRLADTAAHRYHVTLTIAAPTAEMTLALPVWIPGSYLVREFGRHLSGVTARQGKAACTLTQVDKTTWRVACTGRAALVVEYEVYAFDTSVRTAFLDDARGFFNATSLCLRVLGRDAEPHRVTLAGLPKGWQVATAMAEVAPLTYQAADYDELADQPFELGTFWRGTFKAGGVPHEFIVAGAWPSFDGQRLLADAQRICATQIAFWHGKKKPPFGRYVFMLNAMEEGYGGLEHRASTALVSPRKDLPRLGEAGLTDGYVSLLGLISHEYFHTWNVKRLKPAEFLPYDLTQENYTELLWFFEGFTSYYDDLMLLRAGLIDAPRYLKLVSRTLNLVRATPGQQVQSLAEASFDAWVKYYRPDENTANATVSYYTKGALLAMLLDWHLRAAGQSLDALMQQLWASAPGGAVTEARVADLVEQLAGADLRRAFLQWVHARAPLPLEAMYAAMGLEAQAEPAASLTTALGLKVGDNLRVTHVFNGGAAAAAGVSAGDELIAIDGWRLRKLDDARQWLAADAAFDLVVARGQRLRTLRVKPLPAAAFARTLQLAPLAKPAADAAARRQAWLGV
ncbi:MAG: peptidase M61 [Proteobacteria bacterium]|nr:peptidase M61 [Pseudomonadota bacterium]